jgi:uncharacterized protein (TIGR02231 family)
MVLDPAVIDGAVIERLIPPRPDDLTPLAAPVTRVTLLEDRAQVLRSGTLAVSAGLNRLCVTGVAPVLQDLSLKASSPGARVADVRARRAIRVRRADRPAEARALEEKIEALARALGTHIEDRAGVEARYGRVWEIVERGLAEVAVDAGWGMLSAQAWRATFESLFERARALRVEALGQHFAAERCVEDIRHLALQRRAIDSPDTLFVAWIELDVVAEQAGEIELAIEYTVPNALWRPMHSARLADDGTLTFATAAVVWQNTGEAWADAELVLSTARSSLGTEPPLLADDLLHAQKKSEQVIVGAREVAVQRAGVEGGAPRPGGVELPGVDDGGEVRNLRAPGRTTIPSDGRPNLVPIGRFTTRPEAHLVAMPEVSPAAFFKTVQVNAGAHPILAGPVELIRDHGFVGWTEVLFVAPGEAFELSFGPDDAIRIVRSADHETKVHPVEKWTNTTHRVRLYLSNVSGDPRVLELRERVPVSEIEHVRVTITDKKSSPGAAPDANGFIDWKVELPGNSTAERALTYVVGLAPGVASQ